MLENTDYCDYETCVALREVGYDAPQRLLVDYFGVYDGPQYDERIHLYDAQKWLREEKDIHLAVYSGKGKDNDRIWVCNLVMEKKVHQLTHEGIVVKTFSSYEEALSEGIKEAVKILKEK
jgi:hypothetical protein